MWIALTRAHIYIFQYVGGMFVERNGLQWMLEHDFEYFGFYIRPQYFSNSLSW